MKKRIKKSIAIDMDETVADMLSRQLQWYERTFSVKLERADLYGKKIYDVVPKAHLVEVKAFPDHPDFFKDLPVIDGAVEAIKTLSSNYEVFFVSAAMEHPNSFTAKYQWLKQNFPFVSDMNYIFCGFKGMLNCDYLIDDSSRHLDVFEGQGLLFDAMHNKHQKGYERMCSWQEVVCYLS
ncbi:5'-3'-deoxyribonucleotidase [Agaribacterium sp. ZY112]|uniref:5' nucleotidase, NT5C type n=1 Tax=Agaribacterium sp. ZY112 TaxID=3233574 RepID=UPI003525A44F